MITLGIETTAHTYGTAVLDSRKKGLKQVLSNVRDMYRPEKGGINPFDARDHHIRVKEKVLDDALLSAGVTLKDIDLITFSQAPGLPFSLKVGCEHAKQLALQTKKPLVGVNHCIAHLEIGKLSSGMKDPVFLFISGANTQVISYAAGRYRIFGETLDIGLGNFIDSFARVAGIPFPGGPKISELASKSKNLIELPYTVKGMDVAFSGLLTNLRNKYESKKYKLEDLAFSLQEYAFAMVLEVAERAMAHLHKKELMAIGGVASNTRFRGMATILAKERRGKFSSPPQEFVVDNAAMIAYTGAIMYKADKNKYVINPHDANFLPKQRTDDVEIRWIK